jgi:hypothetical protein
MAAHYYIAVRAETTGSIPLGAGVVTKRALRALRPAC